MINIKIYIPSILLFAFNTFASDKIEVEIPKGSQHEECFYINNKIALEYEYSTNSPLDFNFHYHDDNGMNFLVKLAKSSENKKTIKPLKNKQVYCLMWVNSEDKPATLTYHFTME